MGRLCGSYSGLSKVWIDTCLFTPEVLAVGIGVQSLGKRSVLLLFHTFFLDSLFYGEGR